MKTPRVFEWAARDQRAKRSDGINLIARTGTVEDLAECYALHESLGLPYANRSWRNLGEMWRALLFKGGLQLCVVADRANVVGTRIVSFSAIVFVTDEFCSEARSKLSPYLGVELTQRYLSGRLPVLNREQVALANAGDGLNVALCFEGQARDGLSPGQSLAVLEKQGEALHLALRGYHIKEFLAEPIGRQTSQWMFDAGARVRRDYSNYFRRPDFLEPEFSRRPLLVGLTREEALAHSGGNIASLFVYTAPRFHFSRSERVLLQHALVGETCEQLAASLCVSTWTVKKRWHAIYDRVAEIDSELLPAPIAYGGHSSSRGAERRRHLLNYLRQHLEELRPYEAPRLRRRIGRRLSSVIQVFVAGATFFAPDFLPCLYDCLV